MNQGRGLSMSLRSGSSSRVDRSNISDREKHPLEWIRDTREIVNGNDSCQNNQTHEVDKDGVPTRLENPCRREIGTSHEWDDPRAGVNLELAMRRRTARVAAYERKNRPSIAAHLAPAFQGKNTLYSCSTRKNVIERPSLDGATMQPRVRSDIPAMLGGNLEPTDFILPRSKAEPNQNETYDVTHDEENKHVDRTVSSASPPTVKLNGTKANMCNTLQKSIESGSRNYRPRGTQSMWITDNERLRHRSDMDHTLDRY